MSHLLAHLRVTVVHSGTGYEVMSRIAVPMVGGMISSTVLTLAVIPARFMRWLNSGGWEGVLSFEF